MDTPTNLFNLMAELLLPVVGADSGGDHTRQYVPAQTFPCRLRPGRRRGMSKSIGPMGERMTYTVIMYCPGPSVIILTNDAKVRIVASGEVFSVEGFLDNARADVYQTVMLRRVA